MIDTASREEWCERCDGKGRVFYPNGGPWGIGGWGKCFECRGTGVVKVAE